MPFTPQQQPVHQRSDDGPAASTVSQLYFVDRARLPWVTTPIANATAPQRTPAYRLNGESYLSAIVYGTATAVSGTIWGSHTNRPGSWVPVATFSAMGEVTVSHSYGYVLVSLDSVTGGSVSVDLLLVKP